jgi:hypothetical protein
VIIKTFTMKIKFLLTCSISFTFIICCSISDCNRTDYGTLSATFYNDKKEPLEYFKVYVFPFPWNNGNFRNDFVTIDEVVSYYGAEEIETDANGKITITVSFIDGASSCDAPSEIFDSEFGSIIFYYVCNNEEIKHLQINKTNGLTFIDKINKIDSVFIQSSCFDNVTL